MRPTDNDYEFFLPNYSGKPSLLVDGYAIRTTVDAGPVCGCEEKYNTIHSYVPFVVGGVNPYNRRKIPGNFFSFLI